MQNDTRTDRLSRAIDDVRFLLRSNRGKLNMKEVRRHFLLFGRQDLLDELLAETSG